MRLLNFNKKSAKISMNIHYLEFSLKLGSSKFRSHWSNKEFQTMNSKLWIPNYEFQISIMLIQMCNISIWHASLPFSELVKYYVSMFLAFLGPPTHKVAKLQSQLALPLKASHARTSHARFKPNFARTSHMC